MHNSPTDMAETIDRLLPTVIPAAACQAVAIGGSAGGIDALIIILSKLPENFQPPVLVVQHLHPSDNGAFSRHLETKTQLPVIEPSDKTVITPNRIYTAPANYHMLVESVGSIALSIDPRVRWSRPSIDVLFESAARAWGSGLTAIILSGTNDDGTQGVRAVRKAGGHTIAQAPSSAGSPFMPRAAIDTGRVDVVLPPEAIVRHLIECGIK